jgi:hypothetical protein
MTSPQELYDRLSDALGAHDVNPAVRAAIQQAYMDAGADSATWEDLPHEVKVMVEEVEALPRTSWADPADVPDDTPDDF